MITVFGIPNCDTIKKARVWLAQHSIPYIFHDYKKAGADMALLADWVARLGWQALLNTRGTTWRALNDEERADMDDAKAIALMQRMPSLIRRPVVVTDTQVLVGFEPVEYERVLAGRA